MSALLLDPAVVLAEAARLREEAVTDQTYRLTPLGNLAGRYLDELAFHNYSPRTIEERERVLALLAFDLAHLDPHDVNVEHLKRFLTDRWRDAAVGTRSTNTSHVRVFFAWAHENDHLPTHPGLKLRGPRVKDEDSRRRAYARSTVAKLVRAQEQRRDRLGIQLLYWCGLRRMELRQVQIGDFDFYNRSLTVHGKGGTVLEQSLPEPVAEQLELYFLEADAQPDWFLLSPQKKARYGSYPLYRYELVTVDPRRPYSLSGLDRWWQNCRDRAGLSEVQLHELRHTAGTHFHQESHDLVATQHFMRHKNPATTAKHYIHLDRVREVSEVQRRMADPLDEGAE